MDATPDIIDQLTAASVVAEDGRRLIRAATACRIIGVREGQRAQWERRGVIRARRYRVRPRCGASLGVVVAWPLEDVIRAVRTRQRYLARRWSPADDDYLLEHLGKVHERVIARKLGHSVAAVRKRAYQLGTNRRCNTGLLTTGQAAALCRRTRQAVRLWLDRGLRYSRLPGGHREKMIDPADLLKWLRAHPTIWQRLPEASQRALQRMVAPMPKDDRQAPTTYEPTRYRISA